VLHTVTEGTIPVQHANNILGQLGPRCPTCSGLGRVLHLVPGSMTRHTSQCACKGTGINQELLQQQAMSSLLSRLDEVEKTNASLMRKLDIYSKTKVPQGRATRQFFQELIAWATADGTAVANTTTEAIIFPNVTIPGNYMADGRVLRMTLSGRVGATATPTLTIALRYNGVAGTPIICQTSAITVAAVTAAIFRIEIEIQTRANGSSGSLFGIGQVNWGQTIKTTNTPDMMGSAGATTPAAVTADLTVDWPIAITADWSAANASNTLTGHNYFLESLN
jgi:hypothetical protein